MITAHHTFTSLVLVQINMITEYHTPTPVGVDQINMIPTLSSVKVEIRQNIVTIDTTLTSVGVNLKKKTILVHLNFPPVGGWSGEIVFKSKALSLIK